MRGQLKIRPAPMSSEHWCLGLTSLPQNGSSWAENQYWPRQTGSMGPLSWEGTIAAVPQDDTEATKEKQESPGAPGNRRKWDDGREVSAWREVLVSEPGSGWVGMGHPGLSSPRPGKTFNILGF